MSNIKYTKGYVKDIKESEKGTMLVGAVASTESKDRDGDIVKMSGWELDNFKKAPRLLWSHDHTALPIGKVTNISNDSGELKFDAVFAEKNKFASEVAEMFRDGFINTFSVGFIPKERNEDGNITKQELLEISAVNVPSNADARTQLAFKSFNEKSRKWLEDNKSEVKTEVKDTKKDKPEKEDTKLLLLNQISQLKEQSLLLKEITNTLEEFLKETKKVKEVKKNKPKGIKVKENSTLLALKVVDRAVEHLIRKEKERGE